MKSYLIIFMLALIIAPIQAQTTRAEKKAHQKEDYNKAAEALTDTCFFLKVEFINANNYNGLFNNNNIFIVAKDGKATWQTASQRFSFGLLPINTYILTHRKNGDIACKMTLETNDGNKDGITINILLKNNTNTAIADLYVAKWSRNIQNTGNYNRTTPNRVTGKIISPCEAGDFQKYIWQSLDY